MLPFGRRPRKPFDDLQSTRNAGPCRVNNGPQRFIKILILRNAKLFDLSILNPASRILIPISMDYDNRTAFHRAGTQVAFINRKLSIPAPAGLFRTVSSRGLLAWFPGAEHPEALPVHPRPEDGGMEPLFRFKSLRVRQPLTIFALSEQNPHHRVRRQNNTDNERR